MIWSIAWRNIWRNKLRSLVVILAVTLGLYGVLLLIAISNGMIEQKTDEAIHNEITHIQVHNPEFVQDNSLRYPINDASALTDSIARIKGIEAVAARVKTMAMASTAVTGTGVIVNGINPVEEVKVSRIYQYVRDGTYFKKESKTPLILISQKLASKLKAKTGSKIVLTLQNTAGDLTYGLFRVTGIYKTFNDMYDEPNVFVKRTDLESLTDFDPSKATEIGVLLNNLEDTKSVTDQMKLMMPGLSIMTWYELSPMLKIMSSMMDLFSYFLLIIILAAMAFGIINTMLMSILERTRELGMLMAVGMNRKRVFIMIMLETIFLALVGTAIGIVVGVVTIKLTEEHGINFARYAEGFESFGYSALVYPSLYTSFYIIMTILVIITAILSSIYPARKALSFNPAEAIRQET